MTAELRELVAETVELSGGEGPAVWEADAPVLDVEAMGRSGRGVAGSPYFVGIIGGKDVGKSALVNALAGRAIAEPIGWGEGTQGVIAYAHAEQAEAVGQLLEREVPGRWRIVTHEVGELRRQVLLDLPDIDSHWADHVTVTRKMLRHMLYPVWVQSVEKYADRQVQELLRQVAEGNDPGNFVFVLNKVDQVERQGDRETGRQEDREAGTAALRGGASDSALSPSPPLRVSPSSPSPSSPSPIEELRQDFGRRIANVLGLDEVPRVYAVAATRPGDFELPELRRVLARERSKAAVKGAIEQAGRRQAASVLAWARGQRLGEQLQRLRRLEEQAEELIAARITPMLLEPGVEAEADAGRRLELIDASLGRRVRHWPLVNVLHAVLWPVLAMIRANVARGKEASGDEGLRARLTAAVQGVFAQLYQSQPVVGQLYGHRKLWEAMAAEQATGRLMEGLGRMQGSSRQAVVTRAGRASVLGAPVRWGLTIGALLWFPLVQPVLMLLLPMGEWPGLFDVGLLLVRVISVTYLLENGLFLLLWYFVLWLVLRWHTQRRVDRMLESGGDAAEAGSAVAREWVDELLEPLRRRAERMERTVAGLERLEREVG